MNSKELRVHADKPLLGAIICCTSIAPEDRTSIAEYAESMGAEHKLDLTSDVTHLLVGNTDSEKYRYVAKEREDVRVLRPQWVEAVRERWMNDLPLDLNELEAEYRLPTLFGLKICITGFDDQNFRAQLQHNVIQNGGQYSGDLTKDVTHLIAAIPDGKKYEFASHWGIKIVSVKWYKDTLDRRMQLDEKLYHPTMLPEVQGLGARELRIREDQITRKRRVEQPQPEANRKIRRTASTKFNAQNEEMWRDIAGGSAQDVDHSMSNSSRQVRPLPNIQGNAIDLNSLVTGPAAPRPVSDGRLPPTGILAGAHFVMRGFDLKKKDLLHSTLEMLGATMHESIGSLRKDDAGQNSSKYLILWHASDHSKLVNREELPEDIAIVTELWLEWCMTMKKLIPIKEYPFGRTVQRISVPNISKVVVNTSGFHQLSTLHISKIVNCVGAKYSEIFTPEVSVLVCHSAGVNRDKIVCAQTWSIPVVGRDWLVKLMTAGRIPSFEQYLLGVSKNSSIERTYTKETAAQAKIDQPDITSSEVVVEDDQHIVCELPVSAEAPRTQEEKTPGGVTAEGSSDVHGVTTDVSRDRPASDAHVVPIEIEATSLAMKPLQEMSPNLGTRRLSKKKRMFQPYDGTTSPKTSRRDGGSATGSQHDASYAMLDPPPGRKATDPVQEFLELKAEVEARTLEVERQSEQQRSKPKKLFGRAHSNLSDSSHTSANKEGSRNQTFSRVSSVNSLYTDGLGQEVSNLSKLNKPTHQVILRGNANRSLAGPDTSVPLLQSFDHNNPLLGLTTSQMDTTLPPDPTQLSYEPTAEAKELQARLARKRKERARLMQNPDDPGIEEKIELSREESEKRRQAEAAREEKERAAAVIRDDETLVGAGRRTRGRDKALRQSMAGLEEGGERLIF